MRCKVGPKILLVDDEPLILRSMAQALRFEGYETLGASTPEEAIALMGEATPSIDLLITDILMPRMSGHALAALLRQRQRKLLVLFISGSPVEPCDEPSDDPSNEGEHPDRHGHRAGDAVLLKPFGLANLLESVHQLVGPPLHESALASLAAPASEQDFRSR